MQLGLGLSLPLVGKWGGLRYDQSLFANGEAGFIYDLSLKDLLFQLSNGTTPVTADADPVGWAQSLDPTRRIATQTTSARRPTWKTPNSATFDGSDDNLLTTLNPSAAMTLAVKFLTADATTRVLMGTRVTGDTNSNSWLAAQSGVIGAGVGSQIGSIINGGPSIVGVKTVGAVVYNGTTVKLYNNGAEVYNAAQAGSSPSTQPYRLGALSTSGSASSFYLGDLYNALAINRALTPTEILNLTNAWGTS